ncbi:MAG: AgmX/PglI C-terminal domain-containing protein [Myxococcales bacterium]|nr:AgmX/PglI C-terminal domain-containing protein [Myxococcales bacterium]
MSDTSRVCATRVSAPLDEPVLALSLRWGDRLLSLEHVGPGQRPHIRDVALTWTEAGPSLTPPRSPRIRITPDAVVSVPLPSGLTLEARLRRREAAPEGLEPSREQLFFLRVFAFATLGLLAAIAMMVVTPALEDGDLGFFHGPALGPQAHYVQPIPVLKKVMDAAPALVDPGKQGEMRTPAKAAAHPAGERDKRAEARSLLETMMGGPALNAVTAGFGAGLDEALANLGPSAPSADASGLAGLGSRGTGPGASTRGLGIGGTGTVGGLPGLGLPELKAGHKNVTVICELPSGTFTDGLSRDEVLRVVQRHQSEIRFCFESALQKQPSLSGKVSARWVIAPSGDVEAAEISEASLDSADAQACMLSRIRRWRFPTHGGDQVVVNFPWLFSLAGEGEATE